MILRIKRLVLETIKKMKEAGENPPYVLISKNPFNISEYPDICLNETSNLLESDHFVLISAKRIGKWHDALEKSIKTNNNP